MKSTQNHSNSHLSYSRLSRYEQCPLSYCMHYIDKLQSEPGVPLLFGSLLHAVLEQLYRWVIREEHVGRIPEEHATEA